MVRTINQSSHHIFRVNLSRLYNRIRTQTSEVMAKVHDIMIRRGPLSISGDMIEFSISLADGGHRVKKLSCHLR